MLQPINSPVICTDVTLDVVVVNDASTLPESAVLSDSLSLSGIREITGIDLKANVGHQLAIAARLNYSQEKRLFDAVLVMDADGEDTPADALALGRNLAKRG